MAHVSENTHILIEDLYGDYLAHERKQFETKSEEYLKSFNSNGERVIHITDSWIYIYTKAIEINPNDFELYFKRANFYEIRDRQPFWNGTQDFSRSLADYSEVIRLKPDYIDAYLKRCLLYKEMELKDEAISDYNNIIRLNPEYGGGRAVLYGFITKHFAVDIV